MNTEVSVIIATHNRKAFLSKTLLSFNNQNYSNFEVIVIEDGSKYNQKQIIQNLNLNYKIKYHYIENRGRAGARNFGISNSNGEILLFFDDHSQPVTYLIEEHVRNHLKHNKYGGFRGRIEYSDAYKSVVNYRKPRFFENLHNIVVQNSPIINFGTHNLSVRRKILEDVGTFDEEFTLYGAEDQEFGIRIKKAGYKLGYLPKALVYNIKIPKNTEATYNRAIESGKMAALLIKKHPEYKGKMGLNIFNNMIYKNDRNYHLYTDYLTKKVSDIDLKTKRKAKFIIYYFSMIEHLK